MNNIIIIKNFNELNNFNIKNFLYIICLSMDAYYQLHRSYKNIIHISKFIDIDEIYLQSYNLSTNTKIFDNKMFNHFIKIELCETEGFIFYDYFFSKQVSDKIIQKFNKEKYTFFIPKINPYLNTIWAHNHQINLKNTNLFHLIFKDILLKNNYKVIDNNISNNEIIKQNNELANKLINWQLNTDNQSNGTNNISKQISKLKKSDVLIDHWGIDLNRLIDYKLFNNLLINNKIKTTNICYRTGKIKNFKNINNSILSTLEIQEFIFKGQTYGINLSYFNNNEIKFIIKKYIDLFKFLKTKNLFYEPTLNHIIELHIFYIARFYIINEILYNKIIRQTNPQIYVGSNASCSLFQIAKFICKKNNIKTISFPHSPKVYIHDKNYYKHYDINLFNTYNCKNINENIYKLNSNIIGLSNNNYKKKLFQNKNKYNIVFGTRSWGGFYNTISFLPTIYNNEFNILLKKLETNKYNTIIKSHPNGDITSYYDLITKDYKNVKHISKGWKYDMFLNITDILVLFELPSFFIYALFSNIPIVLITGAMTKILKEKLYYPIDLFPCVETSQEAFAMIENIINNKEYRETHLKKQLKFLKENIAVNSEKKLINVILNNLKNLNIN